MVVDDHYWNDYPNPHGCTSCKYCKDAGFREYECTNPNGYWYEDVINQATDACDYWEGEDE